MQGTVISEMMENGLGDVMEENEPDVQTKAQERAGDNRHRWQNGQCVLAMPSSSPLNPTFDLSLCRNKLENSGFQVPVRDLEEPLTAALDVPSVRRFMVFNSALFHFILAPVLYVVVWCAIFSTLHLYISIANYWVLCLCVSLVAIFLTAAIIFILHHSNKELNVNIDVRLIQVNERLVKHKLLVAMADWVQNCSGNIQLYFVYWDMSRCLKTLTETLEEGSFLSGDIQKKLKKKLSHLVLVSDAPAAVNPEVGEPNTGHGSDEERPLLRNEEPQGCSTSSSQQDDSKVTSNHSLIPDSSLTAQDKAHQLLMTYSALYVKLLVSQRLTAPSHHRPRPRRNHCTIAPFCLCQYIRKTIFQ